MRRFLCWYRDFLSARICASVAFLNLFVLLLYVGTNGPMVDIIIWSFNTVVWAVAAVVYKIREDTQAENAESGTDDAS
jgi:hypothetical protein